MQKMSDADRVFGKTRLPFQYVNQKSCLGCLNLSIILDLAFSKWQSIAQNNGYNI
jgi:hypothetical protein